MNIKIEAMKVFEVFHTHRLQYSVIKFPPNMETKKELVYEVLVRKDLVKDFNNVLVQQGFGCDVGDVKGNDARINPVRCYKRGKLCINIIDAIIVGPHRNIYINDGFFIVKHSTIKEYCYVPHEEHNIFLMVLYALSEGGDFTKYQGAIQQAILNRGLENSLKPFTKMIPEHRVHF